MWCTHRTGFTKSCTFRRETVLCPNDLPDSRQNAHHSNRILKLYPMVLVSVPYAGPGQSYGVKSGSANNAVVALSGAECKNSTFCS